MRKVRDWIAVVSFVMAVISALATMFSKNREKQTMASIVAVAFLLSFFINVSMDSKLFLQAACAVAFAVSVLGGIVTIFSNEDTVRMGAIITGIVSLGTSLLILFMYLGFSPL
jgi:uncharacterized membrane protein